MTEGETRARIKKQPHGAKCQGCGEKIASEGSLSAVEYVKTKRGSELFFHRTCADKVWQRRI